MSRLTDLFFENERKTPDKTAIWCDGETATYSEFGKMFLQIANMLLNNGVKQGNVIGVPMNNSVESAALFFAAAEMGAALAPINPTLPAAAVESTFGSVSVTHIIARKNFFRNYRPEGMTCFCLDSDGPEGAVPFGTYVNYPAERISYPVSDDSTLILTLTSGSTGEPKPIELSQKNKIDRAFAHRDVFHLTSEDRVLAATPLYHSLAERLVIMPMLLGATAILMPRFTPELWLKCIEEQKVTFSIPVSAQLASVLKILETGSAPDTGTLRCVVSSSALLEQSIKERLIEKLHCQFHEMYGTSETSTATDINFTAVPEKNGSVGSAFWKAELKIADDNGKELPYGEVGEILVKSPLAFKGYYRLPEKTAESYDENGFFKTGDLGRLDEDGYLTFCGRKKELIITGAVNVYPPDIENVIIKIDGVKEVAAFAYPDERLGEVVAVAVVREEGSELTKRDIQRHCVRNLADFQQPHEIFFLPELPKNAMGKIVKGKLLGVVSAR